MDVSVLQADGCISIGESDELESLTMGRICSFYYLKHQTMGLFATSLKPEMDFPQVCAVHKPIFVLVTVVHCCLSCFWRGLCTAALRAFLPQKV